MQEKGANDYDIAQMLLVYGVPFKHPDVPYDAHKNDVTQNSFLMPDWNVMFHLNFDLPDATNFEKWRTMKKDNCIETTNELGEKIFISRPIFYTSGR